MGLNIFTLILNKFVLNLLGFDASSHDRDPHEIKVVYDHTHIVSYRHLRVGNVGERVCLLAFEWERMLHCWGFSR